MTEEIWDMEEKIITMHKFTVQLKHKAEQFQRELELMLKEIKHE